MAPIRNEKVSRQQSTAPESGKPQWWGEGEGGYLVGEVEGGEADEGPVAGDLVDDEVGVALLEGAAEAGERGGEAGDADIGLGEGGAALRRRLGDGAGAAGEGAGRWFCEGERGEDGV
jgi:hypothetical protein